MVKNKHPLFQTLVEISELYDLRLQEINQHALNVFANGRLASTLQDIGKNNILAYCCIKGDSSGEP